MTGRVESLVAGARADTGLEDFGEPSWREGLEVLVDAIERESRLTTMGEQVAWGRLRRQLANRLRVEGCRARHPEIDAERIVAPIFIVGLPRTGTTALSHLLCQDPQLRSLRVWESQSPVPPPEAATQHDDPRIAEAQQGLDLMYAAFPRMKALHYETATTSTECQDLLGMAFRTAHWDGTLRVPSYTQWVMACDMRPAYRTHARTLELLQWHCPPKLWHLKTPVHMLSLDALVDVYPDARFVMTHRDPAPVLGSVCSLIAEVQGMALESVDREELGRSQVAFWVEALARTIAFREKHAARFVDLHFPDLLAAPVDAVEGAYAGLGLSLSDEGRAAMARWEAENPRGRHGAHEYRFADYGLEAETLRERFAFYTERFGVAREG